MPPEMQDAAAAAAGREDAVAADPDNDGPSDRGVDLRWRRRRMSFGVAAVRYRRSRGATRNALDLVRTAHRRPPPGAPPWPWPWNGGGAGGSLRRPASPRIFPAMKAFLQFLMLNTCYQSGKKPAGRQAGDSLAGFTC